MAQTPTAREIGKQSARTVPGYSEMVIEVATRNDTNQITSMNLHDKAASIGNRNGTGVPRDMMNANIGAAQVRTLLLKGEVIGEYVNAPLAPGLTFGWSPEALQAVAYVPHSRRLMLMDVVSGAKQEVSATSEVLLPAWSPVTMTMRRPSSFSAAIASGVVGRIGSATTMIPAN